MIEEETWEKKARLIVQVIRETALALKIYSGEIKQDGKRYVDRINSY